MLKIGLIGLGFMGRTHLEIYERLQKEGLPIQLVAICDSNEESLNGISSGGNIEAGISEINLDRYHKYTSVEHMLAQENLDAVDITLPTFLHKDITVSCLNHGLHVLCEKPMALNEMECKEMISAAEAAQKQLMIGQCLRFWPAYVYLKEMVESKTYGEAISAYFFRGGGTPNWSAWLTQNEKSRGAMVDMHVHDTDMIHWLFGKPEQVSSQARHVIAGSGYDVVSTHYQYTDGKVINAQADWTLQGDYGFDMNYRVNFERGNIIFQNGIVKVNPNEEKGFVPELSEKIGYYFQLKYFVDALIDNKQIAQVTPESAMGSMQIIEAEIQSANQQGKWVEVKD
ncbi:Gfo/Idh/MocA family protein [Chengkuizengella axinellae]|uniref:Gfo/Idh/MocA family oxidoreductase n=1 Tax=Chengkuizengella axinellae TaxID=3064388 RepID=A0ABT9J0A4_9BACL|nr:Gfo/Idh/MocA family oxidoreductase [Chengkuizengella sp. 2205SS18-9]MDP5274832.1 Gfo/Idh/MocA family oxidoreductase [Chengkuizengella sp. 2205SS18-9]